MLGPAGQNPVSPGDRPQRWLVAVFAVLALLGGLGYFYWQARENVDAKMRSLVESGASTQPTASRQEIASDGYVLDKADILPDSAEANLNQKLAALQAEAGPQLVVLTVASLDGVPIEKLARETANKAGLGDAGRDDGVLVLVAPAERKVRIAVGAGLEATLTNAECERIIREKMIPLYKMGSLAGGTIAGVDALIEFLRVHPTLPAKGLTG